MKPTDDVAITLQVQEWNGVFEALMNAPYRVAAPLLDKISAQTKAAEAEAASIPQAVNGTDSHAPH